MIQKLSLLMCLSFWAVTPHAAIVSVDWETSGDNLITRDTSSGLDWLDLTETNGISYDDILPQLDSGGQFDGWRYATNDEVVALWSNFGINLSSSPAPLQTNGLNADMVNVVAIIGNIYPEWHPTDYPYGAVGYTGDLHTNGTIYTMGSYYSSDINRTTYWTAGSTSTQSYDQSINLGSYLVQTSSVPIPSTVWLFGSGLIGLIGLARRRGDV